MQSNDPEVLTAVKFLSEVFMKGHKEVTLKKYLRHRRNLTDEQIDLAFQIFKYRRKHHVERPEVTITKTSPVVLPAEHSFLLPAKRKEGETLIKRFLRNEYNYCNVLQCLIEEYWTSLCEMADRNKISISRIELEPIFQLLMQLGRFHKSFLNDIMRREANFGKLFVRNFDFFKNYIQYTKECSFTTKKMREHIHDKMLRKALDQIRLVSRRPNDDMMDLILLPLDRIKDYKEFIDSLCEYADKNQESYYKFLEKASRRIGRIAKWIGLYQHPIINNNEMNKVQQFLNKQCNIISPHRRIIRRGMMIRRTTTWPARNKHYIFFLFNDVLLWTTKKGELQNVVFLRDCEVKDSESKTNRARKFEVVVRGEKSNYFKLLKLECNELRQRNEWYNVMKKEVSFAKKGYQEKGTSLGKPAEDEFTRWIAKTDDSLHLPDYSIPPSESQDISEFKKSENSNSNEDEEEEPIPGHRRYQSSRNFKPHEFDGVYLPLDDNMSETSNGAPESEQEVSYELREKYGDSVHALFPNKDRRQEYFKSASKSNPNTNLSELRNDVSAGGIHPSHKIKRNRSVSSEECMLPFENSKASYSSSSRSTIKQRRAHYLAYLKKSSSITMSLSDF